MSRTAVLSLVSLLTGVLVLAIACQTTPAAPKAPATKADKVAPAAPKAPAAKADKAAPAPKAPAAKAEPAGPTMGGTLTVILNTDPVGLDGNNTTDITSRRVAAQVTEKLMLESVDGKEYVPGLLEKWSISPDGLTYTFDLREGVKFHDGTAFDAEAVKFSMERQLDKEHPYRFKNRFSLAGRWLGPLSPVVEVVSPTQVTMTLEKQDAGVLQYMASMPGFMPSPTAVKELGEEYGKNPVGTGPWKFVEWEPGIRLVFERNEDYWGDAALADRLIMVRIPEAAARVTALKAGEANLLIDVPAELLDVLESDENIMVVKAPARRTAWLNMNARTDGEEGGVEAFQDMRVRWAVAHATNRRAMVDDLFGGSASEVTGLFSTPAWGNWGAPGLKKYEYDVDKARALMEEAGWADGFEVTLTILGAFGGAQGLEPIATAMQADLAKINIDLKIEVVELAALRERNRSGSLEMTISNASSYLADPLNFMNLWRTDQQPPNGINRVYYSNAEYDQLTTDALLTTDEAERRELYGQAQHILQDDLPILAMFSGFDLFAIKAPAQGFAARADFFLDLHTVSVLE